MQFELLARFVAAALLAFLVTSRAAAGDGGNLCCPSDLDGDGAVGSSDLSEMLGAWGDASAGQPADLDDSGEVDAIDIAILLGSWGECPSPCFTTVVVGSVQLADGTPVPDAVLVTEFGGKGVSDEAGGFSFEVEILTGGESLTLTAVASLRGTTLTGTKLVSPITLGGTTDAGVISVSASTGCVGEYGWLPGFGLPGLNGPAYAMTVFDDGTGPALYVGGDFTMAGGVAANNIARWDGSAWTSLGEAGANGVQGWVFALEVFDDGRGRALYCGGDFLTAGGVPASGIAKWDGASWSALGADSSNGVNDTIFALAAFDDGLGAGPALCAGGAFTTAGGVEANRVARWNGSSWSSLGTGPANGIAGIVRTLAHYDDGSGRGSILVAGGDFTSAGGLPANRVAQWNGRSWLSLGTGASNGVTGTVRALATYDDGFGSGPALFVGGDFIFAGGVPSGRIARWNGDSWSSVGAGPAQGVSGPVRTFLVVNRYAGSELYVGGDFTSTGGITANHVAKWNGRAWESLGTGSENGVVGTVGALAAFDDGSADGPVVHVGGGFVNAGGVPANRMARWDGSAWSLHQSADGQLPTVGADRLVAALAVFDDGRGDGPGLYAAGEFTVIGGVPANRVARWDGRAWTSLGTGSGNGVNDAVYSLAAFDDGVGDGPALYVAGAFTIAGGVSANRIARWNGTAWSSLGDDAQNGTNGPIKTLAVFDDGGDVGSALYAGGTFTTAGGMPANRIARWGGRGGAGWNSLGAGAANGVNAPVEAMAVFEEGTGRGPGLFVGGGFAIAGGIASSRIARWSGDEWSALGAGVANGVNDTVYALTVFDDDSEGGPALYVGGAFTQAGGRSANRIARWDGTLWSVLGGGQANGVNNSVYALQVFHDGHSVEPSLYVAGLFTFAGGAIRNRIARWDGTSWSSLGAGSANGVSGQVDALAVFDDGSSTGPALYLGGSFAAAGEVMSLHIAKWGCTVSDDAHNGASGAIAARRPTMTTTK